MGGSYMLNLVYGDCMIDLYNTIYDQGKKSSVRFLT